MITSVHSIHPPSNPVSPGSSPDRGAHIQERPIGKGRAASAVIFVSLLPRKRSPRPICTGCRQESPNPAPRQAKADKPAQSPYPLPRRERRSLPVKKRITDPTRSARRPERLICAAGQNPQEHLAVFPRNFNTAGRKICRRDMRTRMDRRFMNYIIK